MFGFGNRQKKNDFAESNQEEFFFDAYEGEDYDEGYDYDPSYDTGYERLPREEFLESDRGERSSRKPRRDNREESDHSDHLQQELSRLEETTEQLKHQLEVKQQELNTMAASLTEKEKQFKEEKKVLTTKQNESDKRVSDLTNKISDLEAQLETARKEKDHSLEEAKQQTRSMEEELASILVETRKQERETLDRAEYEAKTILAHAEQEAQQVVHDAALDLRVLKQEVKNYRKRLRTVQEENSKFFNRLLANSEHLLDED